MKWSNYFQSSIEKCYTSFMKNDNAKLYRQDIDRHTDNADTYKRIEIIEKDNELKRTPGSFFRRILIYIVFFVLIWLYMRFIHFR